MVKENRSKPLFAASENGHQRRVLLLTACGESVDEATNFGETPLFVANQSDHRDVVRILLASGASVDKATSIGATTLFGACKNGHGDIARMPPDKRVSFIKATSILEKKNRFAAYKNGHRVMVQLLLCSGESIDKARKSGATPLYSWPIKMIIAV